MATQPKTKTRPIKPKRKTNVKVKVKQRARVRKKSEQPKDTIPKAPFIMNDNGLNMRIKIKHKSR
jgi:hypothetical protein